MANFTPQEIEQFLQEFFDVVGARQYVGARYVPIFGRAGEDTVEWDDTAPYEPLTVVMHQGVSYVSRRYVPTGIQITDTDYWVETYRFNAQVEQYRQEVLSFQGQIDDLGASLRQEMTAGDSGLQSQIATIEQDFVPFPDPMTYPKYGVLGQILTTLANGETRWDDPVVVTSEIAGPLIEDWLDDHPEATSTVQDGSISDVKIAPASFIPRANSEVNIDNLNNATLSGVYTFSSIRPDSVIYNFPEQSSGILCVFKSQNSVIMQVYMVSAKTTMYYRMNWGGGSSDWGSWHTVTYDFNPSYYTDYFNKTSFISDLNQATDSPCTYRYNNNSTNAPSANPGNVLMYGNGNDNQVQLAFDSGGAFYVRRRWGSTWGAWSSVDVNNNLAYLVKTNFIGDLNQATDVPCTYRYNNNSTNAPSANPGNVLVFGNGTDSRMQFVMDSDGNFFVRRNWGGGASDWKPWQYLTPTLSQASIATIPQIGVIGDSYASGEIYLEGAYHDVYEQSWPQIIARRNGITVYNYSQGGMDARSFVNGTGERQMQGLLTSTRRNLYLIVLGINDNKSAEAIGTTADIGTSADTFYGNYSRIISNIQTYSPHSKIIIVAPANNTDEGYQRLNTALRNISSTMRVPIIYEYGDLFFASSYYLDTMVSGHPTPSSYGGMANALQRMIEQCMARESAYFYDVNYYDLSS